MSTKPIKVLLIDDIRLPSYVKDAHGVGLDGEWYIAKNYDEGIELLKQGGWDLLCLDHDLGNEKEKTGYDIMCFIEENQQYKPIDICIVSANPVGAKRIQQVINKIYK